jgi:hypothetical protein
MLSLDILPAMILFSDLSAISRNGFWREFNADEPELHFGIMYAKLRDYKLCNYKGTAYMR